MTIKETEDRICSMLKEVCKTNISDINAYNTDIDSIIKESLKNDLYDIKTSLNEKTGVITVKGTLPNTLSSNYIRSTITVGTIITINAIKIGDYLIEANFNVDDIHIVANNKSNVYKLGTISIDTKYFKTDYSKYENDNSIKHDSIYSLINDIGEMELSKFIDETIELIPIFLVIDS